MKKTHTLNKATFTPRTFFPLSLSLTINTMTEQGKPKPFSGHPPPPQSQPLPLPQYGTFQGVSNFPPPNPDLLPAIGFPQPVPPPGSSDPSGVPPPPYYPHGYQAFPSYAVAEGRPVRERRLGCCGIGCGWCLFILGFFLATIPWYVGAIIMFFSRVDYREKPGYIACIVAAVVATIAIVLGATNVADEW